MAKNNKIIFEVVATAKGLKVVSKDAEKLTKNTDNADRSTKRLQKSRDKYGRTEKGVAGISSNSTKNFSKMQQSIDGGGGGGLVRAYALLAANVFALTAAFGVLSRSAQVDTLTKSIETLEIVSGKSIKAVGRDLQEASGFSLDFANALRSTSLALSAGFNADQIVQLGEVAKNASVSLGRNLADSLDRIFRGVIKVEPELLDEIGLFIRVDEAASKYADSLGIAQSELTEFQKRQAFLNESIEQGTKKFQAFEDVDPDAFAILAATFADLAQGAVSFINQGLVPIIGYFQENRALLVGAFGAVAVSLLRQVIPAMGVFRQNARQAAQEASENFNGFQEELKSTGNASKKAALDMAKVNLKTARSDLKSAEAARARLPAYKQGGKALEEANKQLDEATTKEERITALRKKSLAFDKSRKSTNSDIIDAQKKALDDEADALENVIAKEKTRNNIRQRKVQAVQPQPGTFMDLEQMRLAKAELRAVSLENISTTASTVGLKAALNQIEVELYEMSLAATAAGGSLGFFEKMSFRLSATLTALSIKMSELMLKLAPFMPFIMIGIALMPLFAKAIGFGGEASKKFGEALDKSNELLDSFDEKLSTARDTIVDTESSFESISDASTAFNNALVETSESLLAAREAYRQYIAETNGFVRFFTDFNQSGATNIVKNEIEALNDILSNFAGATPEMQNLLSTEGLSDQTLEKAVQHAVKLEHQREKILALEKKEFDLRALEMAGVKTIINERGREEAILSAIAGATRNKNSAIKEGADMQQESTEILLSEGHTLSKLVNIYQKVADLGKEQVEAQTNAKSALDGATDSAREFAKKFITKTDVDKPLSSFRQITAALAHQNKLGEDSKLSTRDRSNLLNSIANTENAVFDIMTKENKEEFKRLAQMEDGILKELLMLTILEDEEEQYAKMRLIQLSSKAVLQEIKDISKSIKNIQKETVVGIEKSFALQKQEKQLAVTAQQAEVRKLRTASNLTKTEIERLATLEINANLTAEIAKLTTKDGEAMTAILAQRKLNNLLLQQELDIATESDRKNIKIQGILKKRVDTQEKLNKSILEGQKLEAQISSALTTGSTTLSATASQKILIAGEEQRLKTAKKKADIEKAILKSQFAIIKAELKILNEKKQFAGIANFDYQDTVDGLDEALQNSIDLIDQGLENSTTKFVVDLIKGVESGLGTMDSGGIDDGGLSDYLDKITLGGATLSKLRANTSSAKGEITKLQKFIANESKKDLKDQDILGIAKADEQIALLQDSINNFDAAQIVTKVGMITAAFSQFAAQVRALGADGEFAATLANISGMFLQSFTQMSQIISDKGSSPLERFAAQAAAISTVIAGFSAAVAGDAKRRISQIDEAIEAEKRLDGKSAQSVAKIKEMEKKKESIGRKAFETNKKLQIAQALVSTAAGAAMALTLGPLIGPILAAATVALGMAQVALIRKTQYNGGGGDVQASNTALTIGGRGNSVDTSQRATAGELAYLRGGQGSGTNANNFTPGGAMGRKGYANGGDGITVGERGPEVITPSQPVDITPNYALGGQSQNINFNISAVDGASVQNMLNEQQGNIISMIRQAANDNGEGFLESVDSDVYGGGG